MDVALPYGGTAISCSLPENSVRLEISEPKALLTPASFTERIEQTIRQLQPDLSDVVIIIADKTRVCGYPEYLPLLIELLCRHGLTPENLRFIIAYGTHPRQSDAECLQCYGEIYTRYRFIHHDCTEKGAFTELGLTSRGVPVRLRSDILDAGFLITMGPICHHYFAGYGGGRKLIFPGCGEKEAIYANHGLYLDHNLGQLAPGCQPGVLKDNPIAEDLFEIAAYREADLAIHGIMDSHGELCDMVVGTEREHYLAACSIHGSLCESAARSYPLVVASCGGFPKDINYIQSHKAIHNASMFVEDGGTLLIFSECCDGVGSETFLPWFSPGGFDSAFSHLCSSYQGNGGTALATMTKTRRIRIIMVTELAEDICAAIGIEKWTPDIACRYITNLKDPVCCISNASLLVRKAG